MLAFRAIIGSALLLLLTGFQTAPGPYVFCVSSCETGEGADLVQSVCWTGPSEGGCGGLSEESGCAGCGEFEPAVQTPCCVADVSCPPFEACPGSQGEEKDSCPYGEASCFYCLPGRVIADRLPDQNLPTDDERQWPQESATLHLHQTDLAAQAAHSHSPPGLLLAESGSDICIDICLLLI